ncbi:pheromone receptor [Ephemerocybe angulata]|uniref:Pheromone receptor n=1 Tax=Ephemerocybe angulata TaxID=980116 RepID=A0A8H6HGW7_9AGAR|nr:pheromone receptor [Tulosesus angulatus]
MAASLIAISFLCAILLAAFAPVKRVYGEIPAFAIVFWLFLGNLMHGVNSSLFADTVSVSSFVWCDISTKVVLGVNAAVPGAFICIGRRMELISSTRKIHDNPTVKRNTMIFEILLCYIVPVIYMVLHLLAQHHRFDIIEDFGCFAAVHPSTPGVVLVWVLPLLLGAAALLLSSLALKNSLQVSKAAFSVHLESRTPTISASLFIRRVATSIVMACITVITALFSLFSVPTLIPWKSWAYAHADMGRAVVLAPGDISNTRLRWWSLLAMSVAYVVLSFTCGEEAKDSYKWLEKQYLNRHRFGDWARQLLVRRQRLPRHVPRAQPSSPTGSLPHMVQLKSGWDDMVDFKPGSKSTWSKGTKSLRSTTPTSPSTSRSPSAASFRGERSPTGGPMTTEDRAFMDSTLSYLGSPPAQTLGIASPSRCTPSPTRLAAPSPTLAVPRRGLRPLSLVIADPVLPHGDAPEFPSPTVRRTPSSTRSSVKPPKNISAVIHADWPVPPETPSPVGSMSSRHRSRSPASDHSNSSSIDEVTEYAAHLRSGSPSSQLYSENRYTMRPFEGSYVGYAVPIISTPQPSSSSVGRSPSLKQSIQSLRESWNRDRARHVSSHSQQDGIIMTVVQETV